MGGGGARGGYGYGYGKLSSDDYSHSQKEHRASPPLSAIDRFLHGGKTASPPSQNQSDPKRAKTKQAKVDDEYLAADHNGFESGRMISWPSLRIMDGLSSPGELMPTTSKDPNEIVPALSSSKGTINKNGKKGKDRSNSTLLIKGPWSEQEDSKLIKLVGQYGVRKWAQVAKNLAGRAGKQCRERWHNHLRPDIKKDSWSEEEERLLIRAHKQCGNKWAEIAKRIPGRTENTIKNHWNATKRRQNSVRRKKKKAAAAATCDETKTQSGKPHQSSSILQDYIMSKSTSTTTLCPHTVSPAVVALVAPTATTQWATSSVPTLSEEDLTSGGQYYMNIDESDSAEHGCEDELLFMQNFFKDNSAAANLQSSSDDHVVLRAPVKIETEDGDATRNDYLRSPCSDNVVIDMEKMIRFSKEASSSYHINPSNSTNSTTDDDHDRTSSGYLYSDIYISYLLEGGGCGYGSSCSSYGTDHSICYFDHYRHHDGDHMKTEYPTMVVDDEEASTVGVHECESEYYGRMQDMDLIEMVTSSKGS